MTWTHFWAFAAGFAAFPVVAVGLTWAIVRHDRRLMRRGDDA